jgi:hypothetical protein
MVDMKFLHFVISIILKLLMSIVAAEVQSYFVALYAITPVMD